MPRAHKRRFSSYWWFWPEIPRDLYAVIVENRISLLHYTGVFSIRFTRIDQRFDTMADVAHFAEATIRRNANRRTSPSTESPPSTAVFD